jgi:hypothetical protein
MLASYQSSARERAANGAGASLLPESHRRCPPRAGWPLALARSPPAEGAHPAYCQTSRDASLLASCLAGELGAQAASERSERLPPPGCGEAPRAQRTPADATTAPS